jgi:hypothetical protein
MYRDRVQWTKIRRRILEDQIPIRQVVRETGISRKTIRKMLVYRWPKPYYERGLQTKAGEVRSKSSWLRVAPTFAHSRCALTQGVSADCLQ